MRTLAEDTSPEAERVLIELWRQASPARQMSLIVDTTRSLQDRIWADPACPTAAAGSWSARCDGGVCHLPRGHRPGQAQGPSEGRGAHSSPAETRGSGTPGFPVVLEFDTVAAPAMAAASPAEELGCSRTRLAAFATVRGVQGPATRKPTLWLSSSTSTATSARRVPNPNRWFFGNRSTRSCSHFV